MNRIQWFEYRDRMNKPLGEYGIPDPLTGELKKMDEKKKSKNAPDYNLVVNVGGDGKDDKAVWHKIGAGWKKDKGISININSLPMKSNVFLFKVEDKEE